MPASLRVAVGCLLALIAGTVLACPFCSGSQLTMAEQVQQADAVLLVKWTGGTPGKDQNPGETKYDIVEVVHQPSTAKLAAGKDIALPRYRAAKAGDLFLLLGTKAGAVVDWGSPLE